jgi:hypothetical protein
LYPGVEQKAEPVVVEAPGFSAIRFWAPLLGLVRPVVKNERDLGIPVPGTVAAGHLVE